MNNCYSCGGVFFGHKRRLYCKLCHDLPKTPKVLKKSHKNLMIVEAGYVYCLRHNLEQSNFIDDVFMDDDFDSSQDSEFDNLCKDLRMFHGEKYSPLTLTDEEYRLCIIKFGEQARYDKS